MGRRDLREPRLFRSKELAVWDRQGGAAKKEAIFTLKKCTSIRVEGGEVLGQGCGHPKNPE